MVAVALSILVISSAGSMTMGLLVGTTETASAPTSFMEEGENNFQALGSYSISIPTAAWPSFFSTGDLNNDSRPDLAVASSEGDLVEIFLQEQNGTFPPVPDITVQLTAEPTGMDIGDLDGDGKDDIVVSIGSENRVYFCYQSNGFSIGIINSTNVFSSPHEVVLGDYDDDNDMDFAVVSNRINGSPNCTYAIHLEANGYVAWTQHSIASEGLYKASMIVAGDCDGDGKDDLVISDPQFDKMLIAINGITSPGGDVWSTLQTLDVDAVSDVKFQDVDGSGPDEIVVTASGSDEVMIFRYNDGLSKLDTWKIKGGLSSPRTACMMDVDDDGIPDLVTLTDGDDLVQFFSTSLQGGYGATSLDLFPSQASPFESEVLDFDLDGNPDLLVGCNATSSNGSVSIYYGPGTGSPSNADDNILFQTGGPTSMVVGDFDCDGDNEIGVLMDSQDVIAFAEVNSTGLGTKEVSNGPHDMLVADLRGSDDLVVSNWGSQNLSLFWSNSSFFSGTEPSLQISLAMPGPNSLASGDLNGDGLEDMIVASQGGVEILYNTGTDPVLDENHTITFQLDGGNLTDVIVGDLDVGDESANGWNATADIAVINLTSNRIEIYPNIEGDFDPSYSNFLCPVGSGQITWMGSGLIDDDDLMDLVIATDDGNLTVFFQDLGYPIGFHGSRSVVIAMDNGVIHAVLGDVDDDGKSEIGVMGAKIPIVTVLDVDQVGSSCLTNLSSGSGEGWVLMEDLDGDLRDDVLFSSPGSACVSFTLQRNIAPVAIIELLNATPIDEGDTVTLYGGNSTDSYSDIDSLEYQWDFGDSVMGNGETVQHQFTDDGPFTVTLRVTDRGDLYNESDLNLTVEDLSPTALFDSPSSADEGSIVQFTDMSSSYPDEIVNWTWDFGDGESVTILVGGDPDVPHVYGDNGTYQVNLTVTDDDGSQDSFLSSILIADLDPTSEFDVSDQNPLEGEAVTFTSTSISHPDEIVNWTWEFGDGDTGYGEVVDHTFESDDLYMVNLTVTDEDGSQDLWKMAMTVLDIPPEAAMGISPTEPQEGDIVRFTDLSTSHHPLGNWTWEFGDGGMSFDSDPDHVYQTEGEYRVNLTVRDQDDSVNQTTVLITVLDTLVADLSMDPTAIAEGEEVQFLDLSHSYHEIVNWTWYFGDGNVSYIDEPSHVYQDNGSYQVMLRARAADGSEDECTEVMTVTDTSPQVSSLYTQSGETEIIEDTRLQFRTSCSETNDGIVKYEWDLDMQGEFQADNSTSVNAISAKFIDEGIYTVAVRVWDSDSYTQAQLVIEVVNVAPEVELAYTVIDSGTIHFFASYYNDSGSDMGSLVFQWAFGGDFGEPVDESEIDHHFDVDGMYTVRLKVIDDNEAEGLSTLAVLVDRTPPKISVVDVTDQAFVGQIIPVSFNVTDSFEIASVILFYSVDDQVENIEMTPSGSNGLYIASLPAQNSTKAIDIWVVATDSSNNTRQTGILSLQVQEEPMPTDFYILGLMGALIIIGGGFYLVRRRYMIDDVFVIFQDGCLISHESRRLKPGVDDELLSSMLVAIQEFVKDSFKDEEETGIRRLDFGEKTVLVEKGMNVYMAVVLHGRGGENVQQRMQTVLGNIEDEFGEVLSEWNGDLERVRGVKERSRDLLNSGIMGNLVNRGRNDFNSVESVGEDKR